MQKSFAKFGIILIQNIRINTPDCIHENHPFFANSLGKFQLFSRSFNTLPQMRIGLKMS